MLVDDELLLLELVDVELLTELDWPLRPASVGMPGVEPELDIELP